MTTASLTPTYPTMPCPGISRPVYPGNDASLFENIPPELKDLEQWVVWKKEERDGKPTKIPYDPKTWKRASSTDQSTWGSYDQAVTAYQGGDFQGIGFVFSGKDDIIGIDWDNVRDPDTGAWDEAALEEIRSIGSYAEISPSGTGAHAIARGTILGDRKRSGNREMYSKDRYFTVTGCHITETPLSVVEASPGSIEAVYNAMIGGRGVTEPEHGPADNIDEIPDGEIPDNEILRMCQAAANRKKFNHLWEGKWSGYPSQSEADSAFCCILAFYTRNPMQIDRIFRKSKLFREKWDEGRGKMTYGMQTIQHALQVQKEHYKNKNQKGTGALNMDEHPEFALTDLGNKDRMLDTYGDQIRYCTKTRGWYIWDGQIWKPDETDYIMILASKVARTIYHEAEMQENDHQRRQIVQWAKTSESLQRLAAMVKTTEPHAAITLKELDSNPNLFNCRNGTLELDSLTFREHRREDMLTLMGDVEYDPDATCPLWEKHLNLVFGGDEAFIRDFQMICGYNLLYDNPEQIFFILWGSGKNGKSKTVEILSSIMGDYAINIAPETLMAKKSDGPRSDLVRLMGSRMATSSEGDDGCQLGEGTLKQITGDEYIVARRLYENEIQFKPTAKIWFATNHKPAIRGSDIGIWRRVWLIPFTVTIPESERDLNISEKLRKEKSGILNWCIAGLRRFHDNNGRLVKPERVKSATDEYKAESDILRNFLADECRVNPGAEPPLIIPRHELYGEYLKWCTVNHEEQVSPKKFANLLKERGIQDGPRVPSLQSGKKAAVRTWEGIRLKTELEHDKDIIEGGTQANLC